MQVILVDRPFIYFIIPHAHGTKLKESRETFKKTTLESSEPWDSLLYCIALFLSSFAKLLMVMDEY
jgi:hypothetical protein